MTRETPTPDASEPDPQPRDRVRRAVTDASYRARLDRVVAYIETALAADDFAAGAVAVDLAELAEVACFSPYHFHRIYRSMVGETAAQTVRRVRLNRAAHDLIATEQPIAAVARRAGYGGVEAFGRAFATTFETSPAAYRARGAAVNGAFHASQLMKEIAEMIVRIEETPALRLAAVSHTGPYIEVGAAFERLMLWAAGAGALGPDSQMIGVYYDDPSSTPAADLRSDACLTLPDGLAPGGPSRLLEIPGGPRAVLRHVGPYAELHRAYDHLYGVWLPESGREPADQPPYERYLNTPRETPPNELITEVTLPLRPL